MLVLPKDEKYEFDGKDIDADTGWWGFIAPESIGISVVKISAWNNTIYFAGNVFPLISALPLISAPTLSWEKMSAN